MKRLIDKKGKGYRNISINQKNKEYNKIDIEYEG